MTQVILISILQIQDSYTDNKEVVFYIEKDAPKSCLTFWGHLLWIKESDVTVGTCTDYLRKSAILKTLSLPGSFLNNILPQIPGYLL